MSALQFNLDQMSGVDDDWVRNEATVQDILTRYVQPNSTLTPVELVDKLAKCWEQPTRRRSSPIFYVPIEMAEQIPFHHPAHARLADLMLQLNNSGKCVVQGELESHINRDQPFWSMFHSDIVEHDWHPGTPYEEGEEPIRYTNLCSFVAQLHCPENYPELFSHFMAKSALYNSTHPDKDDTAEIREAKMIAAAQFVIHHAQNMLELVVGLLQRQCEFMASRTLISKLLHPKRRLYYSNQEEFSWDEWQTWRRMFRAVVDDTTTREEARKFAEMASSEMAIQEKNYSDQLAELTKESK